MQSISIFLPTTKQSQMKNIQDVCKLFNKLIYELLIPKRALRHVLSFGTIPVALEN